MDSYRRPRRTGFAKRYTRRQEGQRTSRCTSQRQWWRETERTRATRSSLKPVPGCPRGCRSGRQPGPALHVQLAPGSGEPLQQRRRGLTQGQRTARSGWGWECGCASCGVDHPWAAAATEREAKCEAIHLSVINWSSLPVFSMPRHARGRSLYSYCASTTAQRNAGTNGTSRK